MNVIFVCTGNTCRSPLAEGFFKSLLAPDSDIIVGSRGIAAVEGVPVSANSLVAASDMGIDISDHKARSLTLQDVEMADYIFTMTSSQARILKDALPHFAEKIYSLAEFSGCNDITDPYGCNIDIYRKCAFELSEAIKVIYNKIQGFSQ